jgi:hypothetical protein
VSTLTPSELEHKLSWTIPEVEVMTGWAPQDIRERITRGELPNVGNVNRFLIPRIAVQRVIEEACAPYFAGPIKSGLNVLELSTKSNEATPAQQRRGQQGVRP